MAEISKEGFWKTYEKMNQEERKIWLQELKENLLVDDEKCSCGGTLTTPEKAGIKPQQVFTDQSWAWTGADIKSVCLKCGAHTLKETNLPVGSKPDEKPTRKSLLQEVE